MRLITGMLESRVETTPPTRDVISNCFVFMGTSWSWVFTSPMG
jgi:hypothetical protein